VCGDATGGRSCPSSALSESPVMADCPSGFNCTPAALCPQAAFAFSWHSCPISPGVPGVCCQPPHHHHDFGRPALAVAPPARCNTEEQICDGDLRRLDGRCNHLTSPLEGSSGQPYARLLPPQYGPEGSPRSMSSDGKEALPSARLLSSSLLSKTPPIPTTFTVNAMQWGQFLAHDLSATPLVEGKPSCCGDDQESSACASIDVEETDPIYGPRGVSCLPLVRSAMICDGEQQNLATAFLDGSQIYGGVGGRGPGRAGWGGRLDSVARGLLPVGHGPMPCSAPKDHCFASGDNRTNVLPGLTLYHTLWHREHNRVAAELVDLHPMWDDEKLYWEARAVVIAEMQHITYSEYLPLLLGPDLSASILPSHPAQYSTLTTPAVTNEFAAAAFRFGHTMVPNKSTLFSVTCPRSKLMAVPIEKLYDNPAVLHSNDTLAQCVAGLSSSTCPKPGPRLVEGLQGGLFANRGVVEGGMDLGAINIQRGRDHGIPGYADYRSLCAGLPPIHHFDQLEQVMEPEAVKRLSMAYKNVSDVDLFVGGLLEKPLPGALLGPTFACIIREQMTRTRVADRFFYSNEGGAQPLNSDQVKAIESHSLARLLCDNSEISFLQPRAFKAVSSRNPLVECSSLAIPTLDLSAWA